MKFLPASRGRSSFTARRAPGRDAHRSPEARRDALTLLPLIGFAALSSFGLLGVACGAGGDTNNPIVGEGPDDGVGPMIGVGGSNGGTPLLPGENCNGADCELAGGPDGVAPPGCGNGMLTDDEACDDGNTAAGDGCAANCLATEPGFSCAAPGAACVRIARCGDGLVAPTEQCDDANLALGDGCSDRCRVELGKKCEGEPSVCTDAICGNGIQEGAEACDDGNTTPFDGCSGICLKEPDCSGDTCVSECGDGLLINEDCDDGNLVDGDGCSSTCVKETGFNCEAEAACEIVGGGCALRAPAIFRDFAETHPDFGEDKACTALAVGAVANTLDANRRPTLSAQNPALACMSTPANFAQWYTSDPNNVTNVTRVGEIVLFDNGEGGYVNRFGALGEQFQGVQQGTDRGFSPTLAACGQICQNEANNQFQCDNQCRPISDQAQQLTNGQLIQLTNQLNQLENANPPDPVAIADVEAEIEAVQAEIADIQAQAAACLGTCETNRTNDAAACTATCKPCFTDPAAFCSEGVPLGFDGNPLFFPVDGITGPTNSPAEARIPDQYGYNGFPFERALFPGRASYNHNFYFTTEVQYWFKYDAATQATLTFLGDDDVWVFINGRLAVDLGGIHVPSRGSVTINAAAGTVNATMQDLRGFPDPALMAPAINRPGDVEQFGLQPGNVYLISVFNAERKRDGSSFQLTLSGFEATPSECTAICGDGVLSFGEECDDGVNDGGYGECGVVDAAGNTSCRLGPFCGDGIRQAEFGEECDIGPVGDAECRGCRILDIPR